MAYAEDLRSEISQGDVLLDVPFVCIRFDSEGRAGPLETESRPAIVLSRDCDIDKPSEWVIVAGVQPLSLVAAGSQGNIRAYRTTNTFYLPGAGELMPESYVNFRLTERFHKPAMYAFAQRGQRILSLSDEARLALQRQIAIFFGYQAP